MAALRLVRGEPAAAAHVVRRRLREIDTHDRERPDSYRAGASIRVDEASLLELLTDAELEQGSLEKATAAAERLAAMAADSGCELIVARAQRARGHALVAAGDAVAALEHLERAMTCFGRLGMPFEVARTRLMLARIRARQDREAAAAEAQADLPA